MNRKGRTVIRGVAALLVGILATAMPWAPRGSPHAHSPGGEGDSRCRHLPGAHIVVIGQPGWGSCLCGESGYLESSLYAHVPSSLPLCLGRPWNPCRILALGLRGWHGSTKHDVVAGRGCSGKARRYDHAVQMTLSAEAMLSGGWQNSTRRRVDYGASWPVGWSSGAAILVGLQGRRLQSHHWPEAALTGRGWARGDGSVSVPWRSEGSGDGPGAKLRWMGDDTKLGNKARSLTCDAVSSSPEDTWNVLWGFVRDSFRNASSVLLILRGMKFRPGGQDGQYLSPVSVCSHCVCSARYVAGSRRVWSETALKGATPSEVMVIWRRRRFGSFTGNAVRIGGTCGAPLGASDFLCSVVGCGNPGACNYNGGRLVKVQGDVHSYGLGMWRGAFVDSAGGQNESLSIAIGDRHVYCYNS